MKSAHIKLSCKNKRQYLFTLQVSRYCLSALQSYVHVLISLSVASSYISVHKLMGLYPMEMNIVIAGNEKVCFPR